MARALLTAPPGTAPPTVPTPPATGAGDSGLLAALAAGRGPDDGGAAAARAGDGDRDADVCDVDREASSEPLPLPSLSDDTASTTLHQYACTQSKRCKHAAHTHTHSRRRGRGGKQAEKTRAWAVARRVRSRVSLILMGWQCGRDSVVMWS
jgi:hypothetical protein